MDERPGQEGENAADFMDVLLRLLEERGVPQGAWLIEIEEARRGVQAADALLRRLSEALIRASAGSLLRLL